LPYAPTWNDRNSGYGNEPHAYVVEYVPEPATILLFGVGAVMLSRRKQQFFNEVLLE